MAAITTFGTLKAAIREYAHRPSAIDSLLSLFAGNVTAEINQHLRCRQMESSTTLTSATSTFTLPSDFLELRAIGTDQGNYYSYNRIPALMTPNQQYLRDTNDRELNYIIRGSSLIIGGGSADVTDLDIVYYARLAAFVNDADTNTVLTTYPNLYLYGAMKEYALWSEEDDAVVSKWLAAFKGKIDEVNKESEMAQYSGGPMSIRVY